MSIADRRARFRQLHAQDGIFVMPNPWDAGSARLLAWSGFKALATTSAGLAWTLGRNDQQVTRDELVAHVAWLAGATDLPLSVDSERCFADDLAGVAETVRLLGEAGAAGCSIEDYDPATGGIDDRRPGRRASRGGGAGRPRGRRDGADRAGREPPLRRRRPRGHDRPARRLPGCGSRRPVRARTDGRRRHRRGGGRRRRPCERARAARRADAWRSSGGSVCAASRPARCSQAPPTGRCSRGRGS